MSEKAQATDEGDQSANRTPKVRISEPLSTLPEQPATEQQLEKVESDMDAFERSALRWTRATFFILAVTCGFIGFQWHEMKVGSKDTKTLAEAAKTQADKMKDMSDAADKIRQAAENMVIQDQRIADNAQKAIEASNRQSKASLDSSIAASRLEQRAWVAQIGVAVEPLETGKPFRGSVTYINSGRTFAKLVKPTCHFIVRANRFASETALINVAGNAEVQSIGVLAPNAQYKTVLDSQQDSAAHVLIMEKDALASAYIYIWGEITYIDVFDRPHLTTFCAWRQQGKSDDLVQCPFHNNAD